MDWKAPAILSLLFLAAAAAPPNNCVPGADNGRTLPTPLDLTGQPDIPAGLAGQSLMLTGAAGCDSALPSAWRSTTLRNESVDVLLGLPAPDTLRPIDEPKRAPQFA